MPGDERAEAPSPRAEASSPRAQKNPKSSDSVNRSLYLLLAAFLLLILGIAVVGYRFYVAQKAAIETAARQQLEAVAELKVRQLVVWRQERLADANVLAAEMMPALSRVLEGREDQQAREQILALLQALRRSSGYANAVLVNANGTVCLALGSVAGARGHYAALMEQVRATGQLIFSDLHYDEGLKQPHLGLSVPLRFTRNGPPKGALLLAIDPNLSLYPLIGSWPIPSRTSETLLVRREGNEVVYLNELRHRPGTALTLRYGLTDQRRPAVRAALGMEGVGEGLDYRGVRVLAAVRKVPGSPWVLVAKVDAEEIYALMNQQDLWLALIGCSLLLAVGAGAGFVLRDLRSRFYQQKYEADRDRRALLGHYDYLSRFANDIILLMDERGQIVEANDRAVAAYGYPREELIGMPQRLLRDSATIDAYEHQLRVLEEQESLVFETRHRRRDGTTFPVEVSARRIVVEGAVLRQHIVRDITERSKLQAQLLQAQKMECVGRLAGGVAHDFNNLLTVINGCTDLALKQVGNDDYLREMITEIERSGQRAADLTRQLLAFSRRQVVSLKVVDLNEVIGDTAKMLRRLVGEDIQVKTVLEPRAGNVRVDTGQMHQVLLNLAVNARDAMQGGGTLLIETSTVVIDEDYVRSHAEARTGTYVLLAVSDTGTGMDAGTRDRAFEPFFTTKAPGEGTGLGLSTVHGIVKQSDGWISLYSELGKGTTFKIYLPIITEAAETPADPSGGIALCGAETILVVEDQEEVRKLIVAVLSQSGYRVQAATNGAEALQAANGFPGAIDLMITDIVMPGMTGPELASKLASSRPAMRVLYMSGYTKTGIDHQGLVETGVAYIAKPFGPKELLQQVRGVLPEQPISPATESKS
jgi:PAS domain S-box-containing protein